MAEDTSGLLKIDRCQKLYHKEKETDDSWKPSTGAVIKLLLSIRISGALWSILSDTDETEKQWENLHTMFYRDGFPSWRNYPLDSLADVQSFILNSLFFCPGWFYIKALAQSKIAVFTLIRLTIGAVCICGEYCAFVAISNRINISTGRYFLIFTIFSSGMFHASITLSPYTVSMICSFFFIFGLLEDKRWICYASWIISFSLGSWPTFFFFLLTDFASTLWRHTLHKKWIGVPLSILMVVLFTHYACCSFYDELPLFMRTFYKTPYEYLKTIKIGYRPPGTTYYFIQDFICNWNVAALLALVGPLLACKACWKFQQHRHTWKKVNDVTPIVFLAINSTFWFTMFLTLRRVESFMFPMYPNISLFAALACDAIPRLWHKEGDEPTSGNQGGRKAITDPFINRPRNIGHVFVYTLVSFFIVCSLLRINTVYQSYGSEMDIYKGFHEELNAHEEFDRFNDPIKLCLGKSSKRFPSSFFMPTEVHDGKMNYRKVEKQIMETNHIDNLSESSGKIPGYVNLDSCDYVIDIDQPSTSVYVDFREMPEQWKSILSLPYLDADRTDIPSRYFSIPFISSYFDLRHVTTITLYRRIV